MARPAIDMTGQRFGRIVVTVRTGSRSDGRAVWGYQCDCGREGSAPGGSIRDGSTRSCGCLRADQNKTAEKRARIRLPDLLGIKRRVVRGYLWGAKDRGLEFNLSFEEALGLLLLPCHYCGIASSMEREGFRFNGIDRVNPEGGYSLDNCVPCCDICNRAKKNWTVQEFEAWLRRIIKFRFGQELP